MTAGRPAKQSREAPRGSADAEGGKESGARRRIETFAALAGIWLAAGFIARCLPNASLIVPAAGIASALLIASDLFPDRAKKAGAFCFRYRWALAAAVFCLCVCLRLHGSSIGAYDEIFPTRSAGGESTLFGIPRWVRSDEFGVATMKYFSQEANGYALYSTRMSLSPMNMVLDYYSPVWDWTILGKPLSWGFLLFGSETGLSWYWCGLELLLFMTALETCRILTGGRRTEALLGACLAALSPAVQWWVMPHMPPVLLYAMALFTAGYGVFTAKTGLARRGFAALTATAVIGYALSIFPSFQVPCAVAVLVLLAACLSRDRDRIRFTGRDAAAILIPMAFAGVILGRFLLASRAELELLLRTAYPGRRVALGGDGRLSDLFADVRSLFLAYGDVPETNNSEAATHIHLAPLFLCMSPRLFSRMKRAGDRQLTVGLALAAVLLGQIAFMLAGVPRWLGEATPLRYCSRMRDVYGWTAALFTVWGLSALLRHPEYLSRRERLLWPLGYAAACLLLRVGELRAYFSGFVLAGHALGWLPAVLGAAALAALPLLAASGRKRALGLLAALLMFFAGGTVNPVERGAGAVFDHPLSAAVAEIAGKEPDSLWLCTDCEFIFSNFLAANGARVLSATNFYPDPEKWAVIDPEGACAEETNRYANQRAELTGSGRGVELLRPDCIRIRLDPSMLKRLGIRYLMSPEDHTDLLARNGIGCERVAGQDGYSVWRLLYEG